MQEASALASTSITPPQATFARLRDELGTRILGQETLVERMLIALLADGHLLVEGAPGLAKTTAIKALAAHLEGEFQRIQFTPDLLPADLTGTDIYRPRDATFVFQRGPLFHNFILADEVNRAPAKVQSALLEAMGERQITVGRKTYALPRLFLVMATQNPIEQEGTYPLPEAQVDRFMLKVVIGYPEREEERKIMRQNIAFEQPQASSVVSSDQILQARKVFREVYMDEKIESYILDIVEATRNPKSVGLDKLSSLINYGGSPRASIYLALASKAYAFIKRRGFVIPEDVRAICFDVLRHRVVVTYEAEAEEITPEIIIEDILNHVEVP